MLVRLLCPLALALAIAVPAAGRPRHQAAPSTGTSASAPQRVGPRASGTLLSGFVTAPDAARLPGVIITVTNIDTRATQVVVTAEHGGYRVSGLPPGEYEVKAELQGFRAQTAERVVLKLGEPTELHFKLPLGTLSETVTVVGAVVKASIEASEIRESTARDIGEALGQMTGVAKVRKGAIGNDVVLNGFQSRNLTVLIDGERIYGACPNGMDPAVFHADFAEVDHLDVGKGPFDVRHEGSLGGVINVVTRTPGAGFHLNPNVSLGSYGLVNPSFTGSIGNARASVLAGFSYRASDPYRDGSGTLFTQYANYRAETVATRAYEANTRWGRVFLVPRANHTAQVAYTQQRTSHIVYPYLQMDGVWDNADRLNASYGIVREHSRIQTISARAYYSRVEHWMTDALRVSSVGMARDYSMGTQADTKTIGGTVDFGIGGITTGVEVFRRQWDATTMMAGMKYAPQYGIPFVTMDSLGAFLDYQRPVGNATRLEAGGRVDRMRSAADASKANTSLYYAYKNTRSTAATDAGMSAKIRVIRKVRNNLELETGLGRTLRPPDPQERYFALRRAGNDWVGDPELRATTNTGVHIGANYRLGKATASGAVYRNWLSNFVTVHNQRRVNAVTGITNAVARSYANVDGHLTTAELKLTYPVTDRLFASADVSYTRGTKTPDPAKGITSSNMSEIRPVVGNVSLRYDRSVVFAEAQYVLSGQQVNVDSDLQEELMPAYGLLNLRVGTRTKKVGVTVAVDNVLNELYIDHLSYQRDPFRIGVRVREPGRNLYTNVSFRF